MMPRAAVKVAHKVPFPLLPATWTVNGRWPLSIIMSAAFFVVLSPNDMPRTFVNSNHARHGTCPGMPPAVRRRLKP